MAKCHYALTGRDVEHEIIPFMRHSGVSLTVWSPLSGGFLSGKYTRETPKNPEDRLSGFDFIPYDREKGFQLVERLREIGKAHGRQCCASRDRLAPRKTGCNEHHCRSQQGVPNLKTIWERSRSG